MEADATGEGFDFDMIEQATITLTDTARAQLKGLMGREENPSLALRLFVTSGGCSGFQYGMALDDNMRPGDEVVELDGVRVVVDDSTLPHVRGSEIDSHRQPDGRRVHRAQPQRSPVVLMRPLLRHRRPSRQRQSLRPLISRAGAKALWVGKSL